MDLQLKDLKINLIVHAYRMRENFKRGYMPCLIFVTIIADKLGDMAGNGFLDGGSYSMYYHLKL